MSLNDPQWGRGSGNSGGDGNRPRRPSGQDGPPDLEELWRDLNRRINQLFGRGGGGGNRDFGALRPNPRGAGLGAAVVVVVLALIWALTGIFIVKEGQVGVISTFGKFSATKLAGFQWRMPWPIQTHEIVDVLQLRTVAIGTRARSDRLKEALMLTDDENIVDVQFEVQYRIKEGATGARDFLFNSRFEKASDPSREVIQTAESAMREVVGRRSMDSVLQESRQEIAVQVRQRMQEMLDRYGTGILIQAVAITQVQPPEQVQAAFDDAVKAGQDRERAINDGQAYANSIIPEAKGLAFRLTQEAEAYRARTIVTAEGDAARFRQILVEYAKAPAVTRERLYLESMQQVFANVTKVMIDARSGNNLLMLPFDKLVQQAAASADAAQRGSTAPTTSTEPVVPTDSSRNRDPRSRERESR